MPPTQTLQKSSQLTTEMAINAYFLSLGDQKTRTLHLPIIINKSGPPPQTGDIRMDVKCWYGGIVALAQMLEPGSGVPAVNEVADGVTTAFAERGKSALAA